MCVLQPKWMLFFCGWFRDDYRDFFRWKNAPLVAATCNSIFRLIIICYVRYKMDWRYLNSDASSAIKLINCDLFIVFYIKILNIYIGLKINFLSTRGLALATFAVSTFKVHDTILNWFLDFLSSEAMWKSNVSRSSRLQGKCRSLDANWYAF